MHNVVEHGFNPPLGAPQDSPSFIQSPNGSFAYSLPDKEKASFRFGRYLYSIASLFGIGILIWGVIDLFDALSGIEEDLRSFFLAVLAGLIVEAAVVRSLYYTDNIGSFFAIPLIRKRPGRLFAPDKACPFVDVEESATFHQMKLVSDDHALLFPRPGALEIEMGSTRAHILAADLKVDVHCTRIGPMGLRLSADMNGVPWAITIKFPVRPDTIRDSDSIKMERLWSFWKKLSSEMMQ